MDAFVYPFFFQPIYLKTYTRMFHMIICSYIIFFFLHMIMIKYELEFYDTIKIIIWLINENDNINVC